ncbi:hypothetical protein QFC22_005985 [Naganishia vaughanmartiniae]|uniref:Uncharacterized protein n=1 Tax=Naganishia vaughanmartiniae TaxID=1424756 RepID=A0ACC2WQJ0_9TREE|nr:hypothetical protein QFC22_005985 [Naganishia vaughanmartiniae]
MVSIQNGGYQTGCLRCKSRFPVFAKPPPKGKKRGPGDAAEDGVELANLRREVEVLRDTVVTVRTLGETVTGLESTIKDNVDLKIGESMITLKMTMAEELQTLLTQPVFTSLLRRSLQLDEDDNLNSAASRRSKKARNATPRNVPLEVSHQCDEHCPR